MVIVKLIGGLGNQLFQYAAARRIAFINDMPIKIDISPFVKYKLHKYSLTPFSIIAEIATQDELATVKCTRGSGWLWRQLTARFDPYYQRPIVRERVNQFDPNILKVSGNVYLDGYWQSERYFKDIEAIIQREFTLRLESDAENLRMAALITKVNAVSVHVRRGDYVSNVVTNEIHGTCSLEYYREAIEIIGSRVPNPHFFVFSDDPAWVKKNLSIHQPSTYVTHNDASRNYEDLNLMSLCRHNIIANSTFSWWGAWLNMNPEKIVVAPRIWFMAGDLNKDLVPGSWLRI